MKNEILGLNLRVNGNFFVQRNKNEIQVHKLPASSSFDSIQKLALWDAYKYIPNVKQEIGTI